MACSDLAKNYEQMSLSRFHFNQKKLEWSSCLLTSYQQLTIFSVVEFIIVRLLLKR